ncbi:MAG TPA: 4-hydroxy-3-methylbut-2-enyl diphosphate reductase [Bacillales bacterium]|nr:4-hydroxy-3-methylbut-2-enyl diphosphate reductase [Bacillales bacterium]
MDVIKIAPRGYCHGVINAMVVARRAAQNPDLPKPIYILGMLVHNHHVTDAFEEDDIITLDGENRLEILKQVTSGTVIFTAHGVSPEVRLVAQEKGLTTIDATCSDVLHTHNIIREKTEEGYHIVYIGKQGHPEPEGAVGIAPNAVHLVTSQEDVKKLRLKAEKILVTNQTTLSQWDVKEIIHQVVEKYPQAEVYNEICFATQTRQEAVAEQAGNADLLIVVGDPRSNNSNRLVQVSEAIAGTPGIRIENLAQLDLSALKGVHKVAVTAGASTPTPITKQVIRFLEQYDPNDPSTWNKEKPIERQNILPKVKI